MEGDPVLAAQFLSILVLAVFLALGARVIWRRYFSRNFQKAFPGLMRECFDCNCPRGWEKPVRRAMRGLSRLQKKWVPDLQVNQVKEKFGGLRIYTSYGRDRLSGNFHFKVEPIIEEAEEACRSRCQVCGGPGMHRVLDGWHATLCRGCETDKKIARNCRCPYREE